MPLKFFPDLLKLDQNNSAFNIHHIPSSISLETPSERSASVEPTSHEQHQQQKSSNLNLPNGNLPNSRSPSFTSTPASADTILTIANDQTKQDGEQRSRKINKLLIMEPIDSIC